MLFQRKYFYNDDYFKEINSEDKAYWLGFLYADGHVDNKECSCKLKAEDKLHLQKFLDAIGAYDVPLYFREDLNEYGFSLHSKIFINNLQKLGFTNNKTYDNSDTIFNLIPNNFKKDFIRGYWDGDGCIGSYPKQRNYTAVVSLNKKLLESFSNFFNTIFNDPNFSKVIITEQKYYRIRLGSKNAYKVCNYLYKDSIIYLERKYKKFLELKPMHKNYINIRKTPSGKYEAYIKINYQQKHLGTYNTIKEAIIKYNEIAIQLGRKPQIYVGENLIEALSEA